jgi:hypothetical protein
MATSTNVAATKAAKAAPLTKAQARELGAKAAAAKAHAASNAAIAKAVAASPELAKVAKAPAKAPAKAAAAKAARAAEIKHGELALAPVKAPVLVKGNRPAKAAAPAKAAKAPAKAPVATAHGRFANPSVKLALVPGAKGRTGVLGTIIAAVGKGLTFGQIEALLAKEYPQAQENPHRFAVRFVGRCIRRGAVQVAK